MSDEKRSVGQTTTNGDVEDTLPPRDDQPEDETDNYEGYLSGFKLYLIVFGLCISVLLVALDQAILATAIPTITSRFDSLEDVGWYGSVYLISTCACQPLAGKIYGYFSLKWTYLFFLAFFEVGSLVCAVAPSSPVLIIGRAIAGIGSAGLFSGALTIIAHTIPLRLRPIYSGFIGSMFGIANIMGPLVGGLFTQYVSWRWCFYINLPCGAVSIAALIFFFAPPTRENENLPFRTKLLHLDIPGFLLFMPTVIMILLAITWGGSRYPWNSATIIGLFCGFGGLLLVFMYWQWRKGDEASIPPRIIAQRTVLASALTGALTMGALQLMVYYVPIWLQVIKGVSPSKSGVMNLPMVLGNVIFSILAGILVTKLGYTNPWFLVGTTFMSIGAGLLTTFEPNSGHPEWIGYQFLFGAGVGCIIQMPLVAVQTVLPMQKVATGTAIVVFHQFFGGSILLAIGQNIFQSHLVSSLIRNAPGVDPRAVIAAGAGAVRAIVPPEQLPGVLTAYNTALTNAFYVGVGGSSVAFLTASLVEWKSVKNVKFGA